MLIFAPFILNNNLTCSPKKKNKDDIDNNKEDVDPLLKNTKDPSKNEVVHQNLRNNRVTQCLNRKDDFFENHSGSREVEQVNIRKGKRKAKLDNIRNPIEEENILVEDKIDTLDYVHKTCSSMTEREREHYHSLILKIRKLVDRSEHMISFEKEYKK